jgi:DHA1 family multidrug resistance protein-like MFS transporter
VQWRVTFWTMVGVQAISSMAFSISIPFLPLFIQQLGVQPLSTVEVWSGVVGSINFIFAAMFAPVWGALADRYGRKAMVVRSSIFGAITSAMMGASQNIWQLTGSRALMGMFGGFSSSANALVAAAVPETSLGFALGWMATAQMVGTLIGPIIGGGIADIAHDYRAVYYWSAVGVGLAALVGALFVRENFTRKPKLAEAPSGLSQLRELLRHPELAPLLIVLMLANLTMLAVQPVIPLLVKDMVGVSPLLATFAGAAFAIVGVGDLVASPWLGKRSDKLGYRRVVLISLLGAGLFTIPQAFVHNIWVFMLLRFGVGLFLGGIIPTANAWIGRLFPAERRGMVYGLSSSASFFGLFLGPLFGGLVAAHMGFDAVFLITGGVLIACVGWVMVGVRSADPQRDWA